MKDLTNQEKVKEQIIECAKEVQEALGKKNFVYFYREFFKIELENVGLKVSDVDCIYMYYKNKELMGHGCSFIVKGVVIEVKASEHKITDYDINKIKTLLEYSIYANALIINFWDEDIEKGVKEITVFENKTTR